MTYEGSFAASTSMFRFPAASRRDRRLSPSAPRRPCPRVRLAAGVVGKCIEDAEGGRAEAQSRTTRSSRVPLRRAAVRSSESFDFLLLARRASSRTNNAVLTMTLLRLQPLRGGTNDTCFSDFRRSWARAACQNARRWCIDYSGADIEEEARALMIGSLISDILFGFTGLISIINPLARRVRVSRPHRGHDERRARRAREEGGDQLDVRAARRVLCRHADPASVRHLDAGAAHRRRARGRGERLADAQRARRAHEGGDRAQRRCRQRDVESVLSADDSTHHRPGFHRDRRRAQREPHAQAVGVRGVGGGIDCDLGAGRRSRSFLRSATRHVSRAIWVSKARRSRCGSRRFCCCASACRSC